MKLLPRSFYTRRTLEIAPELLGKIFVKKEGRAFLSGKIVEVEAYLHNDPACHAFRGMTERNKVMFSRGGVLYVYFTYGMYFCSNIVTYKEGKGEAVLIRAVEPIEGIKKMMKNRPLPEDAKVYTLTNGPAKFSQAFHLDKTSSGIDLCGENIFILDAPPISPKDIITTTRIGINVAKEKPWRFYINNNPWASRK